MELLKLIFHPCRYLTERPSVNDRSLGHFMDWYINIEQRTVFGMKVPTGFQLIGQVRSNVWSDFKSRRLPGNGDLLPPPQQQYHEVNCWGFLEPDLVFASQCWAMHGWCMM